MKRDNKTVIFIVCCLITVQNAFAQNYDALKNQLLLNSPQTFEGKEIHPKTYRIGMAIINQLVEDFKTIGFDEQTAYWLHATDYVLYDANSNKQIGNTYWIVYKSEDNKIIGTYMMNCENPANNRMMHTSYHFSGGSYKIKEKIKKEAFSHIVCKKQIKTIQRF